MSCCLNTSQTTSSPQHVCVPVPVSVFVHVPVPVPVALCSHAAELAREGPKQHKAPRHMHVPLNGHLHESLVDNAAIGTPSVQQSCTHLECIIQVVYRFAGNSTRPLHEWLQPTRCWNSCVHAWVSAYMCQGTLCRAEDIAGMHGRALHNGIAFVHGSLIVLMS